eukprot:765658-Hanusia_phi.AAC.1
MAGASFSSCAQHDRGPAASQQLRPTGPQGHLQGPDLQLPRRHLRQPPGLPLHPLLGASLELPQEEPAARDPRVPGRRAGAAGGAGRSLEGVPGAAAGRGGVPGGVQAEDAREHGAGREDGRVCHPLPQVALQPRGEARAGVQPRRHVAGEGRGREGGAERASPPVPPQGQRRPRPRPRDVYQRSASGPLGEDLRRYHAHLSEPRLPQREDVAGDDAGPGAAEVHSPPPAAPCAHWGFQLTAGQLCLRVSSARSGQPQPRRATGRPAGHPRACRHPAQPPAARQLQRTGQGLLFQLHRHLHRHPRLHLAQRRSPPSHAGVGADRPPDAHGVHCPALSPVLLRPHRTHGGAGILSRAMIMRRKRPGRWCGN